MKKVSKTACFFPLPGVMPQPEQYTPPVPSKEELLGRKFAELIKSVA